MNDKRYNNVEISGTLLNSNVTLNQSQDSVQSISSKHIEYEIDDSTVEIGQMAKHQNSSPYTFFLLNGDMELHRKRPLFIQKIFQKSQS
jgi:hypothetical protein